MNSFKLCVGMVFIFLLSIINSCCSTTEQFAGYLYKECEKCKDIRPFGVDIKIFDFCVIGKNHTNEKKHLPDNRLSVIGVIEVKTIVFGDLKATKIPYTITRTNQASPDTVIFGNFMDLHIDISAERDVMLFGVGEGDIMTPILAFEIGFDSNDSTKIATELCKTIYNFEKYGVKKEELQTIQKILLPEVKRMSNKYQGMFFEWAFWDYVYPQTIDYIIQLAIYNDKIEDTLSFLESIKDDNGYSVFEWATHMLVSYYRNNLFNLDQKKQLNKISPKHAKLVELVSNLTPGQQQRLRSIIKATTNWPDITNRPFSKIRDNVEQILINGIYQVDADLRNGINKRIEKLSEQYTNDKDYQKWTKEVLSKIFPD